MKPRKPRLRPDVAALRAWASSALAYRPLTYSYHDVCLRIEIANSLDSRHVRHTVRTKPRFARRTWVARGKDKDGV